MPRGQTLASTLGLLKAELGYNLTANVAVADDQILYRQIDSEQKRLAADYDWPFLDKLVDVAATVGTQNLSLPLTSVVFERPVRVFRKYNTLWSEIEHGITDQDYNVSDTSTGIRRDPIEKWRMNSDGTTFEVWPVPNTAQTVRFHGQRPLTSLLTAGSYDSTKTLDLDDVLIVLFVAANRLARTKQQDAQLMLQRAQQRLQMLRVSGPPTVQREVIMGGDQSDVAIRRYVGITVITP